MSAKDLADYLGQRVVRLGISKSEVARRADISRQTWYRLLSEDITDAKLSTMVRLAEALETTPMFLLNIYFGEETSEDTQRLHSSADDHRRAQA
ncbi:helix-turn-helix transcriptional regulator [Thiothrix lacustris]|uniref:Helix-turn-helix transcriptional regulator n=1 Tax=Thiothrix lacustris TaxID=525917 RepID=A0ABY9MKZ5_9GAMM|nr:helix-turn-helix transcriptional regulator [Thiothrix lacustris]WML89232.1 helix-turn-helix transcriptional regulator [Thiothrix lacustris]